MLNLITVNRLQATACQRNDELSQCGQVILGEAEIENSPQGNGVSNNTC